MPFLVSNQNTLNYQAATDVAAAEYFFVVDILYGVEIVALASPWNARTKLGGCDNSIYFTLYIPTNDGYFTL